MHSEGLVNFVCIKSDDDGSVNQYDRGRYVAESFEIIHCGRIAGNVSLLEGNAFLRKILFRFVAEQSTLLGVDNHGFHSHCLIS